MKHFYSKFYPAIFYLFFVLYWTGWHLTLIQVMPDVTVREVLAGLIKVADIYAILAIFFLAMVYIVFRAAGSGRLKKILYAAAIVIALFLTWFRILDWGTFYFAGQHVDNNFWYHAFYVDGTSFLFTNVALVLFSSLFIYLAIFAYLLRSYINRIQEISDDLGGLIRANATVLFISLVLINAPLLFADTMPPNPVKNQYVEIPEIKVITSFIDYAARPNRMDNVELDAAIVEKLKKCGISVKTGDPYPLIKDTIYLDPRNKTRNKPRIDAGTNIIIIFLESFNSVFLNEQLHGFKGLTPNVQDVMKRSFRFNSMYSSSYPTERGMIATLGSTLYLLDRLRGPHTKMKPPIPCKLFLLSDVLKTKGYTNIHVKGGSGLFGSIRSSFINKQHYDKFFAWESVELQMHIKGSRKQGWGLRDDDVFDFAATLLKENKIQEPFLFTMNSLDLHPPYDPTYTTKNAKDITLLNSIYSTDHGFGVFWEYFKNSRYRNNTVLILTVDHAMGAGTELKKFFATFGYPADTSCDIIPCFILFPGNNSWNGRENNTLCTNLDITPTILDMMDIDVKNPFIGLSIFSERSRYPLAITGYYTVDYEPVLRCMSQKDRAWVQKVGWKKEDQTLFQDYMKKIVLNRMLFPENTKKK
jgi:phosphoglycerol transferase MdoB-like AlkP superfamily enzyme